MPLIVADGSLFKFVYRAEEKHFPVFRIKRNRNSVPYHRPDTVKQPNQTVAVSIQKISPPLQHQTTLFKMLGDFTLCPLRARSGHSHIEKKTAELYLGCYKNEKGFSDE
ncbi:hypothetical protein LF943_07815 [Pectobacterium odoriferum]|nr:hypothetical protein [Pectobacterium odoriferum]MCA6961039.1 hypothetical protein [Pectobacterium odoriferum]MCH5009149.1 hypothetical protein [Pectobacterium odoriferum]